MDHLSDFDPDDITLATLFGGDESKVEEKFREFVNTKFSNIGELFGTGAKSITKMIAELRNIH